MVMETIERRLQVVKKLSRDEICMVHQTKLNKKDECDICMAELLYITDSLTKDEENEHNSYEEFDNINPSGEEMDY